MPAPRASTADALLDAAEALFSERGYVGVGVREIVERADANIAAVSYHFGSKHGLYLAAVRRAMERRRTVAAWRQLESAADEPMATAAAFITFVRNFLHGLLPARESDAACRLMLREAIEPTGAIDAVVRDFVEPNERRLMDVIAVLAPTTAPDERSLLAESVLGQIIHYRVFLPFLEKLTVGVLDDAERIAEIADHIARFSLRGMGWTPARIDRAFARAGAYDAEALVQGS